MTVILFADNTADFLDTRAEFLEGAGYRVVNAYSLAEAQQRLTDTHVHLAILDIRLVDDDDEKDVSGLTLAKDPAFQEIPKIMLTDYSSVGAVREALKPQLRELPPAVDFLDKKDGPEAMIRAVKNAEADYVRVNRDLEIQWDARQQISFVYLVSLLEPQLANAILAQRADELEDLFRRLFYDYTQIRIPALFWHHDGRCCLSVLARSDQGAVDAHLVVCGVRESMDGELGLVRKLAPETLQGVRLDDAAKTVHLAAAAYAIPDADPETFRSLGVLFQEGKERPLKAALGHLLTKALPTWHKHGCDMKDEDLMALYRRRVGLGEGGLSQAEVERRVNALVHDAVSGLPVQILRHGPSLILDFPKAPRLVCPDPVAIAYSSLEREGSATLCRISPGRLVADNILVDGGQRTWLTDFACADQAPPWWDFVCLEALFRFDVGQAPDLDAWLQFEECLTRSAQLREKLPAREVVAQLKANVVLIEQIRSQAASEAGLDPLPYEAGLLVWAVAALARSVPDGILTASEQMHVVHLLLAAALLARRVAQPERAPIAPPEAFGSLRMDADGVQVWRGNERIQTLGEQEKALFRCFLENAGQVVRHQRLMTEAFGKGYSLENPRGSLTSLIRRLRQKIEPDPAHPRYLLTCRGEGYRLEKDG